MNVKFFFPLLGLALGVFITADLLPGLAVGIICIGISLLLWVSTSIICKNPIAAKKFSFLHSVWICVLFTGIGSVDYELNCVTTVPFDIEEQPYLFSGEIKEVQTLAEGDRLKVKIKKLKDHSGKDSNFRNFYLILKTDGFSASTGEIISFITTPYKLGGKPIYNDYARRMRHQGIIYGANLKSENIKKTGISKSIFTHFNRWRDDLTILIEKSSLNRDTKNFIISLILGNRSFLSEETRQKLSSAGLAHILALSGLHVGIILSFLFVILFPLAFVGMHKWRKVIALLLLWTYVLISGSSPSTVRAALMASFVILAFILERKNSSLNALFASILFIILIDPFSLWNIGLQLSFLCVASILIFTERFNPIDSHNHPFTYKTVNAVLISIIATLATWTLIAYYFRTLPVMFLPANIILLPLLPFFIGGAMIYLLFLVIGVDLLFLATALDLFHNLFVHSAEFLSFSSSYINISIPSLSVFLWLLVISGLTFFLYSKSKYLKKIIVYLTSIAFILSISLIFANENASQSLRFKHSFTSLQAQIIAKDRPLNLEFPRNSVSSVVHKQVKITGIDAFLTEEAFYKLQNLREGSTHYLFIGPNADINQMSQLIGSTNFEKVILHAGIGKNKKAELLHLLDDIHWDKIYSLRDNGSLEFDL